MLLRDFLEKKREEQKESIKEMYRIALPLLGKEVCDIAQYYAISVTDEEYGYYVQNEAEGERIFFEFCKSGWEKVHKLGWWKENGL